MAEYTYPFTTPAQVVQPNQDVLYSNTTIRGNCNMYHREGSGIVSLRGNRSGCCNNRARYEVDFNANIAIPTGGTVGPISVALAIGGEPLQSAIATVTPAGDGEFWNVSIMSEIEVDHCCCAPVSVRNINSQAIDVTNANLRIVRTA